MSNVGENITESSVKSVLAWSSIAYALGFFTVMLHTARLGFPVLELLSAQYIWVGSPLAVLFFFSERILQFFRSKAEILTRQAMESWKGLKERVDPKDIDVISVFLGIIGSISPILMSIQKPIESLFKNIMVPQDDISDKAKQNLKRLAHFLRGVQAIEGLLKLVVFITCLFLAVFLYVWHIYPLIPQSYGGGAPTTVKLIINTEKVPLGIYIIKPTVIDPKKKEEIKTSMTLPIQLLYSTKDLIYIEGPDGTRLSLSKTVVEGIIWNPKK